MTDLPDSDRPLRIGTRGSPLALRQAHEAKIRLMAAHGLGEGCFTIVPITTTGDRVQDRSLSELGGKGLFTREIEDALLGGAIDIAVHSMKDMPTIHPEGLGIGCFLPREDVRDAFVSLGDARFSDLAPGAVVGTSSLRRQAQIIHRRPDLRVVEFRGNVQTRLRKLTEGVAEATFLAMAGLRRLGLTDIARAPMSTDDMLPAIAQGAIGIEQRLDDAAVAALLARVNDPATCDRLRAERALLAGLDGSCRTPIAGLAELSEGRLRLRGEILRPDGSECIEGEVSGPVSDAEALGTALAEELRGRADPDFFDA
jgi:hydroxymethylbilane synthase